jgi:hypothetical protein
MKKWDDNMGNQVFITGKKAFVKLRGEKPKLAGYFSALNPTIMVMERKESRHMLHAIKGYGFNELLLRDYLVPSGFKVGLKIDNQVKYLLDPKVMLSSGSYLHFKSEGYERQIFLSVTTIETIAMGKWDIPQNESLFDEP